MVESVWLTITLRFQFSTFVRILIAVFRVSDRAVPYMFTEVSKESNVSIVRVHVSRSETPLIHEKWLIGHMVYENYKIQDFTVDTSDRICTYWY